MIGSISGNKVSLRKRISYRNSFQTQLTAELIDEHGRTRIHCAASMNILVTVFLIVWLTAIALAAASMIVSFLTDFIISPSQALRDAAPIDFLPVGMFAFGIGLALFGRYIARGERAFLIGFIRDTLMAEHDGVSQRSTLI